MSDALVAEMVTANVSLAFQGESLSYEGPEAALDPTVVARLAQQKAGILARLRANEAAGVESLAPATWEQRRMFERQERAVDRGSWNIALRVDLPADVTRADLERRLLDLTERHEALRTRFVRYGTVLLQEVLAVPEHALVDEVERSESPPDIERRCRDIGNEPFALSEAPAVRWRWLPAREADVLLMVFHHIVIDGWSLDILRDEIFGDGGLCAQAPAPTMRAHAREEAQSLTDSVVREEEFWDRELGATSMTGRGSADVGHHQPPRRAHRVSFDVPELDAATLRALVRDLRVTEFALCLAVFARLWSETMAAHDFAVLVPIANRSSRSAEQLVGVLRTHLPIRCEVSPDASVHELAKGLGERLARVMSHSRYPALLLEDRFEIDPGDSPPTVGLSPAPQPANSGVVFQDLFLGSARVDTYVAVTPKPDGLTGFFELSNRSWAERDSTRLASRFTSLARSAAEEFVGLGRNR